MGLTEQVVDVSLIFSDPLIVILIILLVLFVIVGFPAIVVWMNNNN